MLDGEYLGAMINSDDENMQIDEEFELQRRAIECELEPEESEEEYSEVEEEVVE